MKRRAPPAADRREPAPPAPTADSARDGASDATLLGWFVARRDQDAFAALVRRHGPMVLGVCRRRLRRREDAEDAFQATFLVLAAKAPALKRPGLLGNWLFGVALRAAKEAKRSEARRRAGQEQLMASLRHRSAGAKDPDADHSEARAALDEEIGRLPEKYRAAVVLCYLQGKGRAEAARQLGWPEGTVATCLTRAKDLLRRRLARKGVATVSAAALSVTLTHELAAVPVPPALAASTAEAAALAAGANPAAVAALVSETAAAVADGVARAMLVTKLMTASLMLLAAVLAVGVPGAAAFSAAATARRKEAQRQFDEVYRLAPGEVVKFIPPPFIPGRGEYYRNEVMQRMPVSPASNAMAGSLVLELVPDGRLEFSSYVDGAETVQMHLYACGLESWELEGDTDRQAQTVEGDWIVRASARRDEKIKAMMDILRLQLNRPGLRVEKRQVERDVAVARGRLALAPEAEARGSKIHIAAGENRGESHWGSGPLTGFLEDLDQYIGRRVIDETGSGGQQVSWTLEVSRRDAHDNPATVRALLANVSRETGLRFETERRKLTVYVLDTGEAAKK